MNYFESVRSIFQNNKRTRICIMEWLKIMEGRGYRWYKIFISMCVWGGDFFHWICYSRAGHHPQFPPTQTHADWICLKFKHFISQVRNPGQSSHKPGKRLQSSCHLNHLLVPKCKTDRSHYGKLWTSILAVKFELGFSLFLCSECHISCFWICMYLSFLPYRVGKIPPSIGYWDPTTKIMKLAQHI